MEEVKQMDFIQQELTKFNLPDKRIAELKEKYGELTISGPKDKDGYKAVREAWAEVRDTRLNFEDIGETLRQDAVKFSKSVIQEQKRIVGDVKPLEDELYGKWKAIDEAKKREQEETERKRQEILQARVGQLIEAGMIFRDGTYTLEGISVSAVDLKKHSDFEWTSILAQVQTVASDIKRKKDLEAQASREEAARQEELRHANLKKEQELLAKQAEMDRREREAKSREEKLAQAEKEAKEATARAAKAEIDAREAAAKKILEEQLAAVRTKLFQMGFAYQGDSYVFGTLQITNEELLNIDTISIREQVEEMKAEMETKRFAQEEWVRLEAEAKAKADLEAATKLKAEKEAQEKAEAQRQAQLRPDADKLMAYLGAVTDISVPVFVSQEYKDLGLDAHTTLLRWAKYVKNKENIINGKVH